MPAYRQPQLGDRKISLEFLDNILREIKRLSNLKFSKAFRVSQNAGGTYVDTASNTITLDYSLFNFGWSSIASPMSFNSGYVCFDNASYLIDSGSVILAGTPCVIYLDFNRSQHTGFFQIEATRPISDAATLKLPIVQLKLTPGGLYTIDQIYHLGDFHFSNPI